MSSVARSLLLGLLLLLASGCDTDSSNPVAATSTEEGILLEDASVMSEDPPLGEKTCEANGTVRNRTPNRILTAIEVIAFSPDGTAVATARADNFVRESNGRAEPGGAPRGTLRPGESGFFHELLSDAQGRLLRTCSGIARIELTEAIFE